MLREDSYGRRKRFDFVAETVRDADPTTILDVGCGTGIDLTRPLALAFPRIQVLGIDNDAVSIAHATAQSNPENLRFAFSESPAADGPFDLVIASEVLEHVEDPVAFLDRFVGSMAPHGRMIVTVPNGYGPFEAMALVETVLNLSGVQLLLRRMKHRLAGHATPVGFDTAPTLAVSPHINFFSQRAMRHLFASAGLEIRRFRPRTFLCGYGIDGLLTNARVIDRNARIADRLPGWCVSDWMFDLSHGGVRRPATWRRNMWSRFRRRLNEWRWGLR